MAFSGSYQRPACRQVAIARASHNIAKVFARSYFSHSPFRSDGEKISSKPNVFSRNSSALAALTIISSFYNYVIRVSVAATVVLAPRMSRSLDRPRSAQPLEVLCMRLKYLAFAGGASFLAIYSSATVSAFAGDDLSQALMSSKWLVVLICAEN